VIVFKYFKNYF